MAMIRVEIPFHLQNLARSGPEVLLEVSSPVTIDTLLDALEQCYPMLCGTVRASRKSDEPSCGTLAVNRICHLSTPPHRFRRL